MFTRKQPRNIFTNEIEQLESRRLLASLGLVNGVLTLEGTMNKDDITISLKAGNSAQLSIDFNGWVNNFNVSAIDSIFVFGRGSDDKIEVSNANGVVPFAMFLGGGAGKDQITGGNFDDSLRGGDDNDELSGGRGNDSVDGDDANDQLTGGSGDDTLIGDAGNDILSGGAGEDLLKGGADNDRLSGGNDNDELWAGEGNDSLLGDDGNDFLVGGIGDDDLDGGAGKDSLWGQLGNDDFVGASDVSSEIKDLTGEDAGNNSLLA